MGTMCKKAARGCLYKKVAYGHKTAKPARGCLYKGLLIHRGGRFPLPTSMEPFGGRGRVPSRYAVVPQLLCGPL